MSLGRYLYEPALFPLLAEGWNAFLASGAREYYPMEAIGSLAAEGRVSVEVVAAPHYDTGEPLGYVQAVVEHALMRPGLGDAFAAWLAKRLSQR